MENGEPFSLHLNYNPDGTLRHYAQLNHMPVNRCISIDFIPQRRMVRYGVYIDDANFYDLLWEQRDCIEAALGFCYDWRCGEKGKNVRRIVCEQQIIPYNRESYLNDIEESMVRLTKFVEVFGPLLEKESGDEEKYEEEYLMKIFTTGDIFRGINFTDMFNHALGTNYKQYMKCYIGLERLGFSDEGIAWFVFMDGTVHGPHKDYLWENRLSPDGNTIEEEYVGEDIDHGEKHKYISKTALRLAFQRDPDATGNGYKCKFVGVFRFAECHSTKAGFFHVFRKISDRYPI